MYFSFALALSFGSPAIEYFSARVFLRKIFFGIPFSSMLRGSSMTAVSLLRPLIKKVTYFRSDADLSGDGFEVHAWLGFSGEEIADLSKVLKAHNSVPAFGTYLPPDQHLTLKLSADLPDC